MTAQQVTAYQRQFTLSSNKPNLKRQAEQRERMLIACCVDEQGNPLFTDADIAALGAQPSTVIEPIFDACLEVCGHLKGDDSAKNSDGNDASN